MSTFLIGRNIEGEYSRKSILQLGNLFVSYVQEAQIIQLIGEVLTTGNNSFSKVLLITKAANILNTDLIGKVVTYVYNNPEAGDIQNKNQIFSQIFKEANSKKNNQKPTLIFIDDMWLFYPKLTSKTAIHQFKFLLQQGNNCKVHLIIGSVLPYRNLLLQLIHSPQNADGNTLTSLGAELVYTLDDLIFFKESLLKNQEVYYPI